MGTFTITINSTTFYVVKQAEISTECATHYEYSIYATTSDDIDISLIGDHENERYILNGVETYFNDTVSGIVWNTSLTLEFSIQNSGTPGIFNSTILTIDNNTVAGYNQYTETVERKDDSEKCISTASSSSSGITTGVSAPQLFNPTAGEVTSNIGIYGLLSTSDIVFVSINGQVLDDSEYSLVGSVLTVTPDNGFNAITDEILVFQSRTVLAGEGFKLNYVAVSVNYNILSSDYIIEALVAGITLTLPTAVGIQGQSYVIKKNLVGTVFVATSLTETIDGVASPLSLTGTNDSVSLVSNGSNWIII